MNEKHIKELLDACSARWEELGASVFQGVPAFIIHQFNQFVHNPLILSITSILLAVAGFILIYRLIGSIRNWGV